MKDIQSLFIAVSLLICLQSCEKTEPDPINVISIEQDFEVYPKQEIGADGQQFFLVVKATEESACDNSYIDAQMDLNEGHIVVKINGVVDPEPCMSGSAIPEILFALPPEDMSYTIEFQKDEFVSTSGVLNIGEGRIELDIENLGGIFVSENTLNLIQENWVWGYFYQDPEGVSGNEYNLEEIKEEFLSVIPETMDIEEGDYDYFSIEADGTVNIPDTKDSYGRFAYETELDDYWKAVTEALIPIMEQRPALKYVITSGKGDLIEN